jgi:hypothetical protein
VSWLNNTLLFLDYYYPNLKGRWKYDYLHDDECFQDANKTSDCGFHVIQFANCAVHDKRINKCTHAFEKFKIDVNRTLENEKSRRRASTAQLNASRLPTA